MKLAITHFENAIRNGSPFEAYYYLAQFQARTMRATGYPRHITSSACSVAVSFYKVVAERGVWDVDLVSHANLAWASGNDRNKEMAMLQWWIAAERGYEPAQNNLAYVLDQGLLLPPHPNVLVLQDTNISFQTRASSNSRGFHPCYPQTIRRGLH